MCEGVEEGGILAERWAFLFSPHTQKKPKKKPWVCPRLTTFALVGSSSVACMCECVCILSFTEVPLAQSDANN